MPQQPRRSTAKPTVLTCLFIFTGMICLSHDAFAGRTESRVWVGPGINSSRPGTSKHQLGAGLQLGFNLTLSEFLSLTTGTDLAYHFAHDNEDPEQAQPSLIVSDVFVGVQWNLDVFTYIPYVAVGLVGYLNAPAVADGEPRPDLGAKLSAGLIYRPSREWSYGASIDLHSSLTTFSEFSLYTLLNVHIGYHWDW